MTITQPANTPLTALTGSGTPSNSLGVSGQIYFDTSKGIIFVKGASAWTKVGQLASEVTDSSVGFISPDGTTRSAEISA